MSALHFNRTELKRQRDRLTRYRRYLPMLHLRQQQLQAEASRLRREHTALKAERAAQRTDAGVWEPLLATFPDVSELLRERIEEIQVTVAGISVPQIVCHEIAIEPYDLLNTPPWLEEVLRRLAAMRRTAVSADALARRRRIIETELRRTTQRVNLFEKVKIPEGERIVRAITIFLDDQQIAAVVRGKISQKMRRRAVM